ncbi:MAG: GTPase domain-containing protein [Nitrospirae bacterium]|nr:GTPase domain-containing protein [Nitrospirota bacterium]
MALFNYASKEVTLKVVYYGPGLSGKTTNLQQLHSVLDSAKTGKLLSLSTETDRTLFFDFLPIEFGKIKDFSIRFQLYTVPGQVKYNATRKLVLKGADAVIFVADSQREMREANIESFHNMRENLISNNINSYDITIVLQYNKRDISNILSIEELNKDLNVEGYVYLEAEAINNKGVDETFQTTIGLLIKNISLKYKLELQPATLSEDILHVNSSDTAEKASLEDMVYPTLALQEATSEAQQEQIEPVFREAPVFPVEKLENISEALKETNQLLNNIKHIGRGLSDELKKTREEQKAIYSLVRDIAEVVEKNKDKKSWFRWR